VLEILGAHLGQVVATSDAAAMTFLDDLTVVHDTAAQLRDVAVRLQGSAGAAAATPEDVERSAEQLMLGCTAVAELATSMMAGLQFQDVTRQVVEHVVAALDALGERFTGVAAALTEPADSADASATETRALTELTQLGASLDRLQSGYVMQRQRSTHAEVLGDAFVDDDPDIDLF
jgi:surface antigen